MAAVRDRLEVLQLQWVHPPALQHLPCNVERDLNGLLSLSALPIFMAFHDSRLSRCITGLLMVRQIQSNVVWCIVVGQHSHAQKESSQR